MSVIWAVFCKDLLLEWRGRERLSAMLVFALLVVTILYLCAPAFAAPGARAALPGLLWAAYSFAALLGLSRAFALELENEAITGLALAGTERGFIFLGKALAGFLMLLVMEAATAAAFALAFGVDFTPVALPFLAVAALGAFGFACAGTFFSAMAMRTRHREAMLPLLMFPLMIPLLIGAVRATEALLEQGLLPWPPLRLLLVTDAVLLIVCYLSFDAVLDE